MSILYADIVGFTQMSSNKTAAELVGLLNDLFGRFDRLCEVTGCEKISTLGSLPNFSIAIVLLIGKTNFERDCRRV